jgi:hypothetical protein
MRRPKATRFGALATGALRHAALSALLFVAAAVLLLEEWLWDKGNKIAARLGRLPLLSDIESWIKRRKRRPALALFMAPVAVVYPIKGVAIYAMAQGYMSGGIAAFVLAKVLATAMFARLYKLTEPAIIQFRNVRRARNAFLKGRAFIHAWLDARPAYVRARLLIRRKTQRIKRRYRVAYRLQRRRGRTLRVSPLGARDVRWRLDLKASAGHGSGRAGWKLGLKRIRAKMFHK